VYDITDYSTFLSLKHWIRQIREFCDEHVKIALVANKFDLVDRIDYSGISKAIYENDEEQQESNKVVSGNNTD
jgi:GTPase SAR1 family protein